MCENCGYVEGVSDVVGRIIIHNTIGTMGAGVHVELHRVLDELSGPELLALAMVLHEKSVLIIECLMTHPGKCYEIADYLVPNDIFS